MKNVSEAFRYSVLAQTLQNKKDTGDAWLVLGRARTELSAVPTNNSRKKAAQKV